MNGDYRRVILRNLKLAFPYSQQANVSQQTHQKRLTVLAKMSCHNLAAIFFDFIFGISSKTRYFWDGREEFAKLREQYPAGGIIFAAGHLGSFSALATLSAKEGIVLNLVARDLKAPILNKLWIKILSRGGNRVISRKGGFNDLSARLKNGENIVIPFDQNVRREFAVFVDWFGKPAATAKSVALAALRQKAPIVVAGVIKDKEGFLALTKALSIEDIKENNLLSLDEKVQIITERAAKIYQEMIRLSPHEWWWFHRRWKTRPVGELENFYS